MADFFNNQNTDEEEQQVNKTAVNRNDYFNETIENAKKKVEERHQNRDIYGVSLPDEVYQFLNENVIKDAIYPEEEAYKWGTAFKYSQAYGIPLQEAYANVDNFNKALWEDKGVQPYKNWFKSVTDMVVLGNNNCQIGDIGNKIIQATDRNDTEELALLMDQYNAIKAENETLQDSIPRNWAVQALQAGAQSAPFTGYSALAGLFGNFIAPAAGTALAGYTSAYLTAGQEYMDLIEQGATHDTAKKVAIVSGGIQGAIEVALGNVPEFMEAGARATGLTKAVKNTNGFKLGAKSVEKIVNDTSKRFHFGPGKRMLADFIVRYGKNMLEEGSEEVLQEIVSIFGQNFAAATDGYDIPEEDRRGFIESAKEAFKGGVMGAITLGFFPTAVNAAMTTANYVNMQEAAQNIQSEKMFTDEMMKERTDKDGNTYRMADIIPSMNDEDLKDQLHQVWENNAAERDANFANIRSTEEIKETSKAHEGYENAIEDEETGEEVHQDVYRENGKLYTNDVVADDGKTGSFRFGDASKKTKNGYGNIEYTMDEDSNTITINELSVAEHRKGLTAEFYDQFAQEHAGWNIVWDPKSDTATKEMLVENNPRGKNNGLNYYAYSEETNNQTRKYLLNQVEKYVPFKLSANEKTQLIGYVNALSKGSNKVFTELYEEMTGGRNSAGGLNELFGNAENAEEALNKDFHTLTGKEGFIASNAATLTRNMRSVIYVGKNGDFGTLLHEIYHAATPFLSDDIKQQMEAVVGKPMDQWNRADNEVFTRGLEDYLVKGYTDNEKVKPILDELSKIVVQFKHYLDDYAEVNPAIQKVFDQLLETDDSVLSTAEKAVAEHEQELKAKQQMEAGEKLAGPTVETQVQKENTLLKKDSIENLEDQVKATLDETSIPTSVTEKIADIINDPNSTQVEKAAAEQWAADADIDTNTAIYQVVHAAAISKIADLNIAVELAQNLNAAQRLEKQLANNVHEDPVYSAKVIKQATHWEKVNGSWIYETDDSVKEVHLNDGISANVLIGEMNKSPDKLVERTERRNFTLQDIITDETVYKMFPSISRIPFKFHNDSASPKINIKSNGVSINLRRLSAMEKTENGFKSVMGTLMQYLIQEKEGIDFNETLALQEEVYRQFDTLKKLSLQAGVNKILNKSVDIGPLQQALLNVSEDVKSMEALNVARRIMKGSDMSELFAEDLKQTQMFYREGINEVVDELTNPVKISHQESIRDIRDKYEGTERWLKAPNGKDTNLTEEQWLQVRTPQFKKWFGDWENYPETASKVVDENGEPKVVYHGSRVKDKFTEFNPDRGFNINAVYFASNNGVAAHFSGTGKNVRFDETLLPRIDKANTADELLSIYNDELGHEAKLEKTTTTPEEAKKYGVKAGDRYGISDSYNWSPLGSDDEYLEKLRRMVKQEAYTALNGSKYSNGFTYACFLNIKTPEIVEAKGNPYWNVFHNGNYSNTESIAAAAMENRFIDGVIVHDVKETDYENILTDDYIVFNPTQIKSATDNNGDFDPTNANILYSTTERLFDTDEEKEVATRAAIEQFTKDPEGKEIVNTMNEYRYINGDPKQGETGYYNVMIATGLLERDIENAVQAVASGNEVVLDKDSWILKYDNEEREKLFNNPEKNKNGKWKTLEDVPHTEQYNAIIKGKDGLVAYLNEHDLIGKAAKPGNALNGSIKNCRPSKACATFCYVVSSGAKYTLFNSMFKSEAVNWYVENSPEEAAAKVFAEWFKNIEKPLRIFDKGDLNSNWVRFIQKFNELGGITQIFSKRPELLSELDPSKNRLLLSIDQTNRHLVEQYPQFDISFLFNGQEDMDFIRKYGYRIGVILPLNSSESKWTAEDIKEAKQTIIDNKKALETFGYEKGKTVAAVVCPHELLSNSEKKFDKAACQVCWQKKIGCYWKSPLKPIYKAGNEKKDLSYKDEQTIINKTKEHIGGLNAATEQFLNEANLTAEQRRLFETAFRERLERITALFSRPDAGAILAELQGPYNEVQAGHDGTTGLEDTNYQTVSEIDKQYIDAVITGNTDKAREMLDRKANEALQAGATFTYKDDEDTVAYKLHRGRVPTGSYDYKKEGPLTLDKILEHNKQHDEIRKWNKEHPDQKKPVPTLFVYKTLGFDREGGSHATYAGTADQLPWETWLTAQAITPMQSPVNGGWYIPGTTGINNTDVGLPGPKEGGSSKLLSFRPAFHSGRGAYPGQMRVIYKTAIDEYNKLHKDNPITPDPAMYEDRKTKNSMLPSKLIAVVEIPGENDYQVTAERYAAALAEKTSKWYDEHPEQKRPKNINPRAQLPFTPDMGYYTYNNQGEEWVLAGQWKQHRLLTLDEIRKINEADGILNEGETTLNWPAGYNMEEYGFNADGTKKLPGQIKIADITYDDNGEVIPLSDRFNPMEADARYQTAYHGSAADFDRFNVDQYGLSGEGSMSFGYGTYVTGSEEIARDYAERQWYDKYGNIDYLKDDLQRAKDYLKERQDEYNNFVSYEEYIAQKNDRADKIRKVIESKKAKGENTSFNEQILERVIASSNRDNYEDDKKIKANAIINAEQSIKEIEEKIAAAEKNKDVKKNLYTVDIPDSGYINWDNTARKSTVDKIHEALFRKMAYEPNSDGEYEYKGVENELARELNSVFDSEFTGRSLYGTVSAYLGGDRNASIFLNKIGYSGIKYAAGQNFGNGRDATNYVIFDDSNAEIVTHIQYQTMDDLYNDARSFETWQDFMDAYEMEQAFNIDDEQRFNQVPETADAQWYQSTWEMAKGLKTEESLNKEEVAEQYARDPQEQQALDAMFTTSMDSDPAMLNDFLIRVAEIEAVDLEGPEWQNVADEEDAAERKRIELLQDFIGTQLTHGNWLSNAQRVRGGEELTQGARNRILGLMRSNPRAYRAIYAELMEDPSYAVPEDETMGKQLAGKLKRYKLVSPDEDIERINPERLKKLSDQIDNIEIAQKLKNGTLPMNNDLDNYLKSLRKQIRDAEKQYNELEKETQSDYQRIADAEARDLLRLHDKLLKAKADYDKESDWIAKQINKGLKISRKYNQKAQNLKANYDEIFRKYKDLEAVIRIDATVEQALKRQNDVYKFKHEISKKKEEADAVAETKKLRTQLVKRVLRRVPFDRIDYDYARKVIAIQRMVEPNIMGGVNRWIGTEGPYLRGVVAGVLTDEAYKNQILRYLNAQRQTKTLVEFIDKLEELKSMDEFEAWWNTWTLKQRKAAAKFLPKEDWIRDLNLEALAKEREESIDLPIEMVETEGQLEDEDGNKLVDKKTGEPIMGPVWELKASQDIKDEVEEAVGPVIFNNILNRPFAEWTTDEMIDLAKVINDLYKEGRDELKAKLQQKKEAAAEIRRAIEKAVKNTGIVINDDDDDETKKRKQDKINKILGLDNPNLKGTEAGKDKGFMAKVNRLLHGYADANVRRVARLLDNQGEGVNTNMLYWKENEAYNAKQKSINERANKITQYMKDHNIDIDELAKTVTVDGREYTVDELLYFKAAAQDFAVIKDGKKKGQEDYYAPTSKNAVMFGNMFSSRQDMEQKSIWEALNKDMQDRIDNELLTDEEKALQRIDELDTTPGTTAYIYECIQRFNKVINAANQLDPKFQGLLDLIQKDYAEQYDRMNKISIEEFNSPVHRVKAYVPLVRLESNGDTNANQVKEDLLATMGGGSEKQAVNKGMTQRRTSQGPLHQKPVQTGIYKTWSNSVERTEHFIAYAPYVRELNRVYKSRDAEYTRRFIESRYGKGMIKYVDDYINEVANPNANKVRNAGDDILRTLRGKTAPAYLAWKASAIIKQGATSPWPYMQFVNPAEYLAASWKCIASRGAMYDAIRQKSVFMAQRVMDPMNDLIDEMAETAMNKWDRGISNFNKKGMAGLEWIDWVCVAPGWLACYEKKYAEVTAQNEQTYRTTKARLQEENAMIDFNSPQYMSQEKIEELAQKAMVEVEKAAVDYADDCTRLCQPSSRSVDISPLFKNSGEAMKAYLQFQTSLNVIWQNLRYDIPYYVANMKKDNIPPAIKKQMFMRITGTILGYTLAGIFMNSIMEGYSNGDDDDDKMQALREAIYYGVTQFTDSIPMIGSAVTNTAEKVITGKSGFISNNTDMTPMVSKVLDIFVQASKGNWLKAAEKIGEGFAMSLGLPVSGTKEILKEAGIDIGDADFTPGVELNEVYGILNNVIPQEDK